MPTDISWADETWNGTVEFAESQLFKPLKWKKPKRIFVCSTSDLFHEKVSDEWIDRVLGCIAAARWHTFLVLTKRPERAIAFLKTRAAKAITLEIFELAFFRMIFRSDNLSLLKIGRPTIEEENEQYRKLIGLCVTDLVEIFALTNWAEAKHG